MKSSRKATQTQRHMTLVLPVAQYQRLAALAKREERSVSFMARRALDLLLEQEDAA